MQRDGDGSLHPRLLNDPAAAAALGDGRAGTDGRTDVVSPGRPADTGPRAERPLARPGPRKRPRHRSTEGSRGRCANPGGRHKMAAPVRAANRAAGGRHAGRGGARSSGRTVRLPGHGSEPRFGEGGGRKEGVALRRKCVRMFTMLGTRPFRCRGNAGRGLLLPGKRPRRLRPGPRPPFPPRARSLPVPPGAAPFPVPPRASAGEGAHGARLAGASEPRGPAGAGGTPAASFLSKK